MSTELKQTYEAGNMVNCYRCGHRWTLRKNDRPVNCPVCKNPKWDVPKAETPPPDERK